LLSSQCYYNKLYDKVQGETSMEYSLVKDLMGEVQRRRKRSYHPKPTLWASQGSAKQDDGTTLGKCLRAGYYEKTGVTVTNPVSDGVTMMGYMGLEIEDGLIELIKRTGRWENNNVKWIHKGVSGEVDIIMNVEPGSQWLQTGITMDIGQVIVEAKSCSGYYANKEVFGTWSGRGNNKVYTPGRPKIAHLMQSALYADMSRGQADGCVCIYVSRDEAKLKEFLVQVHEDGNIYIDGVLELRFTMNDVHASFELLRGYIERKELPPTDYRSSYTNEEVEALFLRKGISAAAKKNHLEGSKPYQDTGCLYCGHRDVCLRDGASATTREEVEAPDASVVAALATGELDFFDAPASVQEATDTPAYIQHGSF
jgi:hypothetical protein